MGERPGLQAPAWPPAVSGTPRRPAHRRATDDRVAVQLLWDQGVISGWERSPFDLRPRLARPRPPVDLRVRVSSEVAATLRSLLLVDTAGERLVFRAHLSQEGVMLAGEEDDFDELIGSVAAEANHEEDRRRQKRLDAAYEALTGALEK